MPEFLLEFLSEEIPARMQANAARDLERMTQERLVAAGLAFGGLRSFAGPRRLVLVADDLPPRQPSRRQEKKGPRATAPDAAILGFLRSTGLSRDALVERDGVLFGEVVIEGRSTLDLLAELTVEIASNFPWPKSMRSGDSAFRWVRPLKSVVCLFDGEVAPAVVDGIVAGRSTRGHRFMGACGVPFDVRDFADYERRLESERVVSEPNRRRSIIIERGRSICRARGLELAEDEALLVEVSGLCEWPTPVLGEIDPAFLDLPPEVIRTAMRTHQKYFTVQRPGGALAPYFVVVANVEVADGGAALARGNARVLSARLADARFFWDADRRPDAFARWAEALEGVTFHVKIGSMAQRIERLVEVAERLVDLLQAQADRRLVAAAARLCKLDLASQMVGEFPELQGTMGGYYVRRSPYAGASFDWEVMSQPDGTEDPLSTPEDFAPAPSADAPDWARGLSRDDVERVADAVRDHYKPVGPSDAAPTAKVTVIVALADKLDTLESFFAVGERPTGSRDPYALRRAALGAIRLILQNGLRLGLRDVFQTRACDELLAFFRDRLKIVLREAGERHDLIDAVFASGDDDLVRISARLAALKTFLQTADGVNLLAGYRRAANILRAEGRKDAQTLVSDAPDPALMRDPLERDLAERVRTTRADLNVALQHERYDEAMASLARLRRPVDAFFEGVRVNDPDAQIRRNRLRILSQIEAAAHDVADFSLIAG